MQMAHQNVFSVKFKYKHKFEQKVMIYIAVSERGISKAYFKPTGLAINQKIYQNQCLKEILTPHIQKYFPEDNFMFCPDKDLSHYAKKTLEFLQSQNIFGELKSLVYKNGWRAKNTRQLCSRIKNALKKLTQMVYNVLVQGL